MDLLLLVLAIVIIGVVVYAITTNPNIKMPPGWATAIQVLVGVAILLYVLSRFVPLPNVLPR